ncbi:MAG TPA: type II and III secretion system protein family protein, partial [Sphingorhabdus sp.]|nr:type II and III secretion system protein family protein [Sphingorhabdus sp.]
MKKASILSVAAIALASAISGAAAPAALAQDYSSDAGLLAGQLDVPLNKSQVLTVDRPFAKAMVGN